MKQDRRTGLQKLNDRDEFDNWSRFAAVMTIGCTLVWWLLVG